MVDFLSEQNIGQSWSYLRGYATFVCAVNIFWPGQWTILFINLRFFQSKYGHRSGHSFNKQHHFSLEPQTTIYKWMFGETTIFYIKIWNHPIKTTIYKWLFGVPGDHEFLPHSGFLRAELLTAVGFRRGEPTLSRWCGATAGAALNGGGCKRTWSSLGCPKNLGWMVSYNLFCIWDIYMGDIPYNPLMNFLLSSADIQAEQCHILSKKFIYSKFIQFHDPSKWVINITPKIQKKGFWTRQKGKNAGSYTPENKHDNRQTTIWRCVCHENMWFFIAMWIFRQGKSSRNQIQTSYSKFWEANLAIFRKDPHIEM